MRYTLSDVKLYNTDICPDIFYDNQAREIISNHCYRLKETFHCKVPEYISKSTILILIYSTPYSSHSLHNFHC